MEITDGLSCKNTQVVLSPELAADQRLVTGASVQVEGEFQKCPPGTKQAEEFAAVNCKVIGECPADTFLIQKKCHTKDFLRTVPHLRPRATEFGCLGRFRSNMAKALRTHLYSHSFHEVHAPVITFSDCEGGGEMFELEGGKEFYGMPAYLTVSAQLHAEIAASAFGRVFTFGPVFRAEKHNTSRHLSEFWMLEVEASFIESLHELMRVCERLLRESVLDIKSDENLMQISSVQVERIQSFVTKDFERIDYAEAIKILSKYQDKFRFPVEHGADLQSEHEKLLAEQVIHGPVFVTNYPKSLKPFYMRQNVDGESVANFDLIFPEIGEVVGGSLREERHDTLMNAMLEKGMNCKDYDWYLDLAKYGSVPHGGFGVGFDRLLQYLTGIQNIKDVVLIPRFQGSHNY